MKSKRINTKCAMLKSYIVLLVMILLLASVTYAWIRREWTPSVRGDNIRIASDGSLVFSLDDNSSSSQSIFDLLNITNVPMKPVSSISGARGEFFVIDFNDPSGYKYQKISVEETSASLASKYGMIEVTFTINNPAVDNDTKYIFFSPSSYLTAYSPDEEGNGDPTKVDYRTEQTLRASISIDDGVPFIIRNQDRALNGDAWELQYDNDDKPTYTHKAITNQNDHGVYYADKKEFYDNPTLDKEFLETKQVSAISDFYGGIWDDLNENAPYYEGEQLYIYDGASYVPADIDKTNDLTYINNYKYDTANEKWKFRNNSNEIDESKCVATITTGNKTRITIRIWIEGSDENCVTEIRNSLIQVNLVFDSVSVPN